MFFHPIEPSLSLSLFKNREEYSVLSVSRFSDLFFLMLQNSFISYDVLHKLRVPQPVQFLQVLNFFHVDALILELIEYVCV